MNRKGFLLDLEGTIVKDKSYTPFEKALKFTKELDRKGIPWIVATNNSTEKPGELAKILKEKGFNVSRDKLLSPSVISVDILRENGVKTLYFLGTEKIKDFFEENGFEVRDDSKVDAVIVGRDKNVNYEKLKIATSALVLNKAKLFSFHMNRIILDVDGLIGPSVGAIATALSYAANKPVVSFGKPSKIYFEKAFDLLGIKNPENIYMVSDDPFTDLAEGKKTMGFKTVFVLSGKYKDENVVKEIEPALRPDYIFEDIYECLNLLE